MIVMVLVMTGVVISSPALVDHDPALFEGRCPHLVAGDGIFGFAIRIALPYLCVFVSECLMTEINVFICAGMQGESIRVLRIT